MPSQTIRFCQARDGVRLAYAVEGQGLPLVRAAHFLTHLEFDIETPVWRPWLEELNRGHQLVRYDGRNCGLSDSSATEPTLDDWVADLEAVVDAAGLERFTLLGCSQGCAISIAYAVRHPERVSALVLFGGYLRGIARRGLAPEQLREARLMLDLVELGWGRENPAFRQVYTSLFIPGGTLEQMEWFNELERRSTTPANALRTLRALSDLDVSDQARQVQCPTLVLHARGDARVPFEEGRRVAGAIPGAQFVPLEGRNHVLLQDEPAFAQCLEHIRDFMARHGQDQARPRLDLTPREDELLELLAHGLDNLQIAAHLGLAEKTVRNKVSAVFDKLQVETRSQAIVKARVAGYGLKALPR
ncbi:MAG: alpha/beta fold hydrolase [Hylemonella sp.]